MMPLIIRTLSPGREAVLARNHLHSSPAELMLPPHHDCTEQEGKHSSMSSEHQTFLNFLLVCLRKHQGYGHDLQCLEDGDLQRVWGLGELPAAPEELGRRLGLRGSLPRVAGVAEVDAAHTAWGSKPFPRGTPQHV